MAEFIYRSTTYGPQRFTVADGGGVVEKEGKQLSAFGGYLLPSVPGQKPLMASADTLESVVRRWWRQRVDHLFVMGHAANGVSP